MAKKKRKKRKDPFKYKKTIINKLIEENKNIISQGYYTQKTGSIPTQTKKNINLAISAFKSDLKGIMKNNPELTAKEVFLKTLRSTKFTSQEEIAVSNMYNELKKFYNYTITRSYTSKELGTYTRDILMPIYKKDQIRWDKKSGHYVITYGKDAGKHIVQVHRPGEEPSYVWEIVN